MMSRPALIARIALFAALVYVLSWGTSYLPNVNFIFFIVFSAGFVWGRGAGILIGAFGMGLWTVFNPYGPAPVPIMGIQIVGASISGLAGDILRRIYWQVKHTFSRILVLEFGAFLCTVLFYLPVNVVDALLFQPFWPRFIGSTAWSLISLGFNLIIFPLLFQATKYLYARECGEATAY
jgi:hypothetical protein